MANTEDAAAWLIEEWVRRLGSSVELMTEARPGLKVGVRVAANSAGIPAGMEWRSIALDSAAGAEVFIGAAEDTWLYIGKSALVAAGVTEVSSGDARNTYLEIVTQSTSGLAQAIAERLERPVVSFPAKEIQFGARGLDESIGVYPVEISLSEPPPRTLYFGWTAAFEAGVAAPKAKALAQGCRPDKQQLPEKSTTLDLLMEVELPVSVSFGRAQLPLRDVLKLNSGSIVELNRTINDPVEIIVNNCVIARGEVVVVEGNYGVRIQQVISREERLRTLK